MGRGVRWAGIVVLLVIWGCGGNNSLRFTDPDDVRIDEIEVRDIAVFVTETAATFRWTSRRAGLGRVAYGTGTDLDRLSAAEMQATTRHEVVVDGLAPATRHIFQVAVETGDGRTFRSDVYPFHTRGGAPARIAFVSDRDGGLALWVMQEDGTNPTRLVADAFQPDWSPDGRQLAFVSRRSGGGDLWVIDADGSNLRQLTRTPAREEWTPAWSPDGARIVYAAAGSRANRSELYLLDVADPDAPVRLTDNIFLDEDPDWSPDGQRLVLVSNQGTAAIELAHRPVMPASVQVFDSAGHPIPAEEWELLPDTGILDFSGAAGGPGERVRVRYQSLDGEGNGGVDRDENYQVPLPQREIFVMNADGSGRQRLTRSEGADFAPAWSPRGDRILFVSDRDRNSEIYVMNTDGNNQVNLTGDLDGDLFPTWSPDGNALAWVARRRGLVDIYRRNLDGSQLLNLTRFTSGDGEPVWGP